MGERNRFSSGKQRAVTGLFLELMVVRGLTMVGRR